jgi:hypothetical protein
MATDKNNFLKQFLMWTFFWIRKEVGKKKKKEEEEEDIQTTDISWTPVLF